VKSILKNKVTVVIPDPKFKSDDKNLQVLRILLSETYVRIDFGHLGSERVISNNQELVVTDIYIKLKEHEKVFELKDFSYDSNLMNTQLGHKIFKMQYFSLYFHPLPKSSKAIELHGLSRLIPINNKEGIIEINISEGEKRCLMF
jgi:hypothetical protein